ncbi:hypothetical protein, partial [Acidisoma silvae]|nr:hypothetical protein [Acidisoma silvae]
SWSDLYSVTEARDRILRILGEGGEGRELAAFLPELPTWTDEDGTALQDAMHWSSAWATTFSASLELAKQGDVALGQSAIFEAIRVGPPAGAG